MFSFPFPLSSLLASLFLPSSLVSVIPCRLCPTPLHSHLECKSQYLEQFMEPSRYWINECARPSDKGFTVISLSLHNNLFERYHPLVLLIFVYFSLLSIVLNSPLILYLFTCSLSLICCSFSSFLKWKLRILIFSLSSFIFHLEI